MTDTSTKKPLRVSTDSTAGPYIMLPFSQLDEVRQLLDSRGIGYWVEEKCYLDERRSRKWPSSTWVAKAMRLPSRQSWTASVEQRILMALADDIRVLRDRVLADLNAAHDYYADTKIAWQIVRPGRRGPATHSPFETWPPAR